MHYNTLQDTFIITMMFEILQNKFECLKTPDNVYFARNTDELAYDDVFTQDEKKNTFAHSPLIKCLSLPGADVFVFFSRPSGKHGARV